MSHHHVGLSLFVGIVQVKRTVSRSTGKRLTRLDLRRSSFGLLKFEVTFSFGVTVNLGQLGGMVKLDCDFQSKTVARTEHKTSLMFGNVQHQRPSDQSW